MAYVRWLVAVTCRTPGRQVPEADQFIPVMYERLHVVGCFGLRRRIHGQEVSSYSDIAAFRPCIIRQTDPCDEHQAHAYFVSHGVQVIVSRVIKHLLEDVTADSETNVPAQAGRRNDVRLLTDARSRPCLQPEC